MFDNAKVLEAPAVKAKASKKNEVHLKGLEKVAALKVVIKNLEGILVTEEEVVKTQAKDVFIDLGEQTHKRPNNFRAVEGIAEASCELRKRSSRSVLTEEEVAALEDCGIPFETLTDVEETFVINPEYANDSKVLAKVEKALKGIKGLPEDFIMKQQGQVRKVVSDETIDAIFAKGLIRKFVDIVSLIALKPKIENLDVEDAFRLAKSIFDKK